MTEGARELAALGLSARDEECYRLLLTREAMTPAQLADALGIAEEDAAGSLQELRALGLVSQLSSGSVECTAVEPTAAIDALITARAAEWEQLRQTAALLAETFRTAQRDAGAVEQVEIVHGARELARWFVRLHHEAREEMLVLDRPPYVQAPTNPLETPSLDRGVRWRAVYSAEALREAGGLDEVLAMQEAGEESRVIEDLPLKMAVADRRIAVLPLSLALEDAAVVIVRESTLLDALVDVFESYWSRAVPIGPQAGEGDLVPTVPDGDYRRIVTLLATGLKDEAVARQLGLSPRTMRRRVQAMTAELGAENRFQAGIQASRRGWV